MPNGGTDCCMNCAHNRANQEVVDLKNVDRHNRIPFCMPRYIAVHDRAWTYCGDFNHIEAKPIDPTGPIYSSGQIDGGYERIPWYGSIEPHLQSIGSCQICDASADRGLALVMDGGPSLEFCSNGHYEKWVEGNPLISTLGDDEQNLCRFLKEGMDGEVDRLLSSGVGVNFKDDYGRSPLHWAAFSGKSSMAKKLVASGADVNATNRVGWTPLHCAAFFGWEDAIKTLMKSGADPLAKDFHGMRAIELAGSEGHSNIVSILLEDSYASDQEMEQALLLAAEQGNLASVVALIDRGADIECIDGSGWTPLLKAVYEGHVTVSVYLLDQGAKIDAENKYGYTAYSITNTWKTSGMEELKSILVSRGALPKGR
jgi:ankyrin repeat protein